MAEWVRFQKWVARNLYKVGLKARANGQAGGGYGVPDVLAEPFFIECKSYKSMTSKLILEAVRQARRDCTNHDLYPIALCHDSEGNIIVAMDWVEFKNLIQEFIVKKEDG